MKDKLIEKLKELIENFLDKPDDPPLIWFRQKDKLLFEIAALEKQVEEQESISDEDIEREVQEYLKNTHYPVSKREARILLITFAGIMRDHPEQFKNK